MRRWLAGIAITVLAVASCENFVDPRIGAGIGASCTRDDECQGAACQDGICANACEFGRCPSGLVCAQDLCKLPLKVGYVYAGPLNQEELSISFESGRIAAQDQLVYVDSAARDDQALAQQVVDATQNLIDEKRKVMVVTSRISDAPLKQLADANASVQFLVYQSQVTSPNMSGFDARSYQGYYLAGIAAAQQAGPTTDPVRFGFLASLVSPPVIAAVNAFTLGARTVSPQASVEVTFLRDLHDRTAMQRDRTLTLELIARGARVVAHTLDNNIPVAAAAEMPTGVWSIAANVQNGCERSGASANCIGSVFFNWAPLLVSVFDDIHHQERIGGRLLGGIRPNPSDSVVDFKVSSNIVGSSVLSQQIDGKRAELAAENGVGRVFRGPIASTGQCPGEVLPEDPCIPDGEILSEDGLANMCFFVQGVIGADDMPAQVPAELDCIPAMN